MTDGQTVLLGGFISDTKSSTEDGVPGLMDVPYLGALFRSNDVSVSRKETLIFITPYIINTGADSEKIIDSVRDNLNQYEPPHQKLIY